MEDEIRDAGRPDRPDQDRLPHRAARWTSTTCEIASLPASRSIVILAPEGDEPDADVIKTILAITNNPDRRAEPYHIVAEIRDRREPRGGADGRPGRGRADPRPRRSDRADHRPDLPPVRAVGRLHRAARLRRRRDLLDRAAGARRPDVRRGAARPSRTSAVIGLLPGGRRRRSSTRPWRRCIGAGRPADRHRRRRRHGSTCRPGAAGTIDESDPARGRRAGAQPGADAGPGLEPARARRSSASSTPTCRRAPRSWSSPIERGVEADDSPARNRPAPPSGSPSASATPPTGRSSTRSASSGSTTSIVLCYSDTLDASAGRRPDADHAAPPARHRVPAGPRLLDRQRDARPARTGRWPRSPAPTTSSSATG